jgi:outer membrane protein OmpA-like peptidoglycan-associated protein
MEEINFKPRGARFGFLWVLGIVVFLTLSIWVFNTSDKDVTYSERSMYGVNSGIGSSGGTSASAVWRNVNLNAPLVSHPDIKISSSDFETRGNDRYTVYSLGENLLFEPNKAKLNSKAELNLIQIVNSINKNYENGLVRVYGYTDEQGSEAHNEDLAADRAMTVKNWLTSKGNIEESRISVEPMGESRPVASNKSATGRHQNRRVEIVAINPQ